jgi:hypothetical protein
MIAAGLVAAGVDATTAAGVAVAADGAAAYAATTNEGKKYEQEMKSELNELFQLFGSEPPASATPSAPVPAAVPAAVPAVPAVPAVTAPTPPNTPAARKSAVRVLGFMQVPPTAMGKLVVF